MKTDRNKDGTLSVESNDGDTFRIEKYHGEFIILRTNRQMLAVPHYHVYPTEDDCLQRLRERDNRTRNATV